MDLIGVSRGHESKITCMESSEDGTVLALGLGNGVVKVWEARAGAARGPTDFGRVDTAQVLKNHKAAVSQVTHSTSTVLGFARSKCI